MAPALILVGIDFSDSAAEAWRWATEYAESIGGEVRLITVRDPMETNPAPEALQARWLLQHGIGHEALTVRSGQAWLELARASADLGALFLVVGTHGRTGYQPIELGSTAARLGLTASCPVILVGRKREAGWPALASSANAMQLAT